MLRLAENEIQELKDCLRYAEFQLAATRQEKESLEHEMANKGEEFMNMKRQQMNSEHEKMSTLNQIDNMNKRF